ncbi:MAG: YihY/virulence factor BrkB family protein, partial [Candidatus Eisenbacteria bacterium]|nr:YihY/virulence factor BrkB family protein [Candidatus Eisenbacteria bacterium]
MKHVLGEVWDAVRLTFSDFFRDHATRLSAALAFYTVFALAPMLVIVIAIAGRVFGADAVRGQVVGQFGSLIGEGPARQVEEMVVQASAPKTSLIATILGVATLLLGATGVFLQLKGALNAVWEVVPRTGGGILRMLRDRALALAMLMGVAFLLLVTLVLSAALAAVGEWAADLMPVSLPVLQIGNFLLSFLVITFLFGMIYKLLPDSKIAWKDVWVGAAVTSFLFSIGKTLIGLYLGRSSLSSVYGAAGSFAILLTWIYYSAAIFLSLINNSEP